MTNFKDIAEARKLLRLGEKATLNEIKSAYKRLAHLHHPDKHGNASAENHLAMNKLNQAYKLLMDYCADYTIDFSEKDTGQAYSYEDEASEWREKWADSI